MPEHEKKDNPRQRDETIRTLVELGADPSIPQFEGHTALAMAAQVLYVTFE